MRLLVLIAGAAFAAPCENKKVVVNLKLKFINTYTTNPHMNLALEEYMFNNIGEDECIFYLWQNGHTVVIGKNQNAYKECKVSEFAASGGFLARRPSGGGAVYHDLGNLNFTFITTSKYYDVDKQLEVIAQAAKAFGLTAEKTGRNDICIDGKKFSGNAFLKNGEKHYHHGTILINVDMAELGTYLNVSNKKLKAKGVDSVKSRVVNLKELNEEITVENMRQELFKAFEIVYGGEAEEITVENMDTEAIQKLYEKYTSDQWRFGESRNADLELAERFSWGEINIYLSIKANVIEEVKVYTDSMDIEIAEKIEKLLVDSPVDKSEMIRRIKSAGESLGEVAVDLAQLITEQDF